MVHYIRFLKLPTVIERDRGLLVKALVTITTDLGESFFDGSLTLVASIRDGSHETVYLQRTFRWEAQKRALRIELPFKKRDVVWPVRLYVGIENHEAIDSIGPEGIPAVLSIWSDDFSVTTPVLESHYTRRVFRLADRRLLHVWEEPTESIARHIW